MSREPQSFKVLLALALCVACLVVIPTAKGAAAREFKFEGNPPIRVVATVGMIADAVRAVGGDLTHVEALMAPGVDPHLYKPSQGDVRSLDSADMIFYSGLHLEGKMVDILKKVGRIKPSIGLAEQLPQDRLLRIGVEGEELSVDPHVWFDASLWALVVGAAGAALAEFDPKHASDYQMRADQYRKEILELHEWAKARIAEIPKERRVLVTAHDAFHYFGRAYDIEVMGLQGVSTATEFGLNDVNRLVDALVDRRIKALFVESSVSRRGVDALREGCLARGHKVVIGGTLFSDAMGDEGTPEGTYPGMFRHNVNAIVGALK